MTQTYPSILPTDTLAASLSPLLQRGDAVKSLFSGTAFPTTDLLVGMPCFRTDQSKLYVLTSTSPVTWAEAKDVIGAITAALISDGGVVGRQILQAATAAAAKALLSLAVGDISGFSSNGASLVAAADYAAMRGLMDVPARATLIASTANISSGGATYIVDSSSITRVYKKLQICVFGAKHNSGSSQQPQLSISGDNGTTWATINCTQAYAAASSGDFSATIWRAEASNANRAVFSSAVQTNGQPYGGSLFVAAGPINAIKIGHSGGSNASGVAYVFGFEPA